MPEHRPVSGRRWYRFDVNGESPLVSGLVWLGVRDDLPLDCAPLSVKLHLTLWRPNGLDHDTVDAELVELEPKELKRLLKRRMEAWPVHRIG